MDLFVLKLDLFGNLVWTRVVSTNSVKQKQATLCLDAILAVGSYDVTVISRSNESFDCISSTMHYELVLNDYSTAATCPGFSSGGSFLCPAGNFCPYGTNASTLGKCPVGTYSNVMGLANSSQCLPCVAGMYCLGSGLTAPSGICQSGFYCSGGSGTANASVCDNRAWVCESPTCNGLVGTKAPVSCGGVCPVGSYCPTGSAHPTFCPPGFLCNEEGRSNVSEPCPAGYYCDEINSTVADIKVCPIGFYCPIGSIFPIRCPLGTSGIYLNASSLDSCIKCPAGY